jgi:hypothetical protein
MKDSANDPGAAMEKSCTGLGKPEYHLSPPAFAIARKMASFGRDLQSGIP